MANLFTLTVVDQTYDTKEAEVQLIHDSLQRAAQSVRSQKIVTSGNIFTDRGKNVGSWTYTPSASKEG